jgi:hypothetical protein
VWETGVDVPMKDILGKIPLSLDWPNVARK